MQRAAVLIAVKQTKYPGLATLEAALRGAANMASWARSQSGFGAKNVVELTDETGPLRASAIKDAIFELVNLGTIEQLVVYFSGHGLNIGRNEFWLLSGAPEDTGEAVNVRASADLARRVGIPHVIFISDACRGPAMSIQSQSITGSVIFPNKSVAGRAAGVDLFYAARLGEPALEVARVDQPEGQTYAAVYTDAVLDACNGRVGEILLPVTVDGQAVGELRPWPLEDYLETEVPAKLREMGVAVDKFAQDPEAEITSRPGTWLARITGGLAAGTRAALLPPEAATPVPQTVSRWLGPQAVGQDRGLVNLTLESGPRGGEALANFPAALQSEAVKLAESYAQPHRPLAGGFVVHGTAFRDAYQQGTPPGLDPSSVEIAAEKPVPVVLRFDDGSGLILPALPHFVAHLTVDGNGVRDVAYEPVPGTDCWTEYTGRLDKLRELRAEVATATRHGVFRPLGEGAGDLARRMQTAKAVDPTLALYAAYAYYALQEEARIHEMDEVLAGELGLRFFDLALLLDALAAPGSELIIPCTPLLSQGWALLPVRFAVLPSRLSGLASHLKPSVWSTFTPAGVDLLAEAVHAGEITL